MVTSCQTQQGEVRSGPMTRQRSKFHNLALPPSLPCAKSLPTLSGDTTYSSNVGSESKSEGRTKCFEKARSPAVRLGDSGLKSSAGGEDYGGLNAFREQLMSDLRSALNEMKLEFVLPMPESAAMQLDADADADSGGLSVVPWNLRSKEKKSMNGEKRGRERFSICLSKREIEDDFMAMVGHRPPQRPNKRKKILQKELDDLFPGAGLTQVTLGKYKVPHPS